MIALHREADGIRRTFIFICAFENVTRCESHRRITSVAHINNISITCRLAAGDLVVGVVYGDGLLLDLAARSYLGIVEAADVHIETIVRQIVASVVDHGVRKVDDVLSSVIVNRQNIAAVARFELFVLHELRLDVHELNLDEFSLQNFYDDFCRAGDAIVGIGYLGFVLSGRCVRVQDNVDAGQFALLVRLKVGSFDEIFLSHRYLVDKFAEMEIEDKLVDIYRTASYNRKTFRIHRDGGKRTLMNYLDVYRECAAEIAEPYPLRHKRIGIERRGVEGDFIKNIAHRFRAVVQTVRRFVGGSDRFLDDSVLLSDIFAVTSDNGIRKVLQRKFNAGAYRGVHCRTRTPRYRSRHRFFQINCRRRLKDDSPRRVGYRHFLLPLRQVIRPTVVCQNNAAFGVGICNGFKRAVIVVYSDDNSACGRLLYFVVRIVIKHRLRQSDRYTDRHPVAYVDIVAFGRDFRPFVLEGYRYLFGSGPHLFGRRNFYPFVGQREIFYYFGAVLLPGVSYAEIILIQRNIGAVRHVDSGLRRTHADFVQALVVGIYADDGIGKGVDRDRNAALIGVSGVDYLGIFGNVGRTHGDKVFPFLREHQYAARDIDGALRKEIKRRVEVGIRKGVCDLLGVKVFDLDGKSLVGESVLGDKMAVKCLRRRHRYPFDGARYIGVDAFYRVLRPVGSVYIDNNQVGCGFSCAFSRCRHFYFVAGARKRIEFPRQFDAGIICKFQFQPVRERGKARFSVDVFEINQRALGVVTRKFMGDDFGDGHLEGVFAFVLRNRSFRVGFGIDYSPNPVGMLVIDKGSRNFFRLTGSGNVDNPHRVIGKAF